VFLHVFESRTYRIKAYNLAFYFFLGLFLDPEDGGNEKGYGHQYMTVTGVSRFWGREKRGAETVTASGRALCALGGSKLLQQEECRAPPSD
jgi:hypothetical protein